MISGAGRGSCPGHQAAARFRLALAGKVKQVVTYPLIRPMIRPIIRPLLIEARSPCIVNDLGQKQLPGFVPSAEALVSREGGGEAEGPAGVMEIVSQGHRIAGLRSLSAGTLTGLYFLQKYRFLTIAQFARIAGFSVYHSAEVLRGLDRWGLIGWFGFVGIPGQGKAPKVYYLRRKGFDILCSEARLQGTDNIEPFSDVQAAWTPYMYHRLKIIDCLMSAEIAIRSRARLAMVKVFVEYRMRKRRGVPARETTDFVDTEETSENKLVPDAAFIMENTETGRRALFFVEMDMGSERIVSNNPRDQRVTSLHHKLTQYDRYLNSLRYSETYADFGEFRSFTLLFVTLSAGRMENIRRSVQDLDVDLSPYYRFTTFDEAMGDLFGPIWKSRSLADSQLYSLVREKPR